jgi:hypothetical protein
MYKACALLSTPVALAVAMLLMPVALVCAGESADLPAAPPENSTMPAFCFAPGTPPDVVANAFERAERLYEKSSLTPPSTLKFVIADRWSYTATDGGGLSQGDPTTLTWSVVPDGTSIGSGVGELAGPSGLRAFLNGIYGDEAAWLAIFQQVFDRWGELTGITYVYEFNDDGAALSYSSSGQLGVRADIRIGGHAIDGDYGILAYNYYPNNGNMVIDTPDSFYNNTSSNSLKLRNTVAHEHGHGLGLAHSCPMDKTKLMEPFLTTLFDGPQHDEILATNRSYGDRFEDNDTLGKAAPLGTFGTITKDNLSVDSNTDADVYGFIVDTGAAVDVTITPIGYTYLSGPQNTNGSCSAGTDYDSLNIQDLEVRVLDVNGNTELAAADRNGVGQPEELDNIALSSGAGTYYVEITGDATDAAQLYQLSMTVSPSDQIFTDGVETGDTSCWSSVTP